MKRIFLDDWRKPNEDTWTLVLWPGDVIAHIREGGVTEISLDHDLGDDKRGTGYDVLEWLDAQVSLNYFAPPKIIIHTNNASARQKMEVATQRIRRLAKENEEQGRKWNGSFALPEPYG